MIIRNGSSRKILYHVYEPKHMVNRISGIHFLARIPVFTPSKWLYLSIASRPAKTSGPIWKRACSKTPPNKIIPQKSFSSSSQLAPLSGIQAEYIRIKLNISRLFSMRVSRICTDAFREARDRRKIDDFGFDLPGQVLGGTISQTNFQCRAVSSSIFFMVGACTECAFPT